MDGSPRGTPAIQVAGRGAVNHTVTSSGAFWLSRLGLLRQPTRPARKSKFAKHVILPIAVSLGLSHGLPIAAKAAPINPSASQTSEKTPLETSPKMSLTAYVNDSELLRLLDLEQARREKDERLRLVKLNPANKRYAEAWLDPEARIIVYAAPNGIGKTYQTVTLLGWTIWPETAPRWFAEAVARKFKDWPKKFRVASTKKEVEEVGSLQAAIKELWPRGRYQAMARGKHYDSMYETDNGWVGDVLSYDQAPEQFEGGDRGLTVFNEPPPEDIYKASVSRTRMGGMLVFPGTPLYNAAWIKDKLVDKADAHTRLVSGEIEEACIEHSVNGHLHHKNIEFMISQYDPDEIEARVHGKFMHLSGRIWKAFDRETFVSKSTLPVYPHCPRFQVIDPGGFDKPFFVIWGQVLPAPPHALQVLMEWPQTPFEAMKKPSMSDRNYADLFKKMERERFGSSRNFTRIMDRRYGNMKDSTGESLNSRLYSHGLEYVDSYGVPGQEPEIETGIQAVKNYLCLNPINKQPMIQWDPSCSNSIRAMERWSLDPKTLKPHDDVWKNGADVHRYLCAHGLRFEMKVPDAEWNEVQGPRWG